MLLTAFVAATEPNPPTWDTTGVKFIDPLNPEEGQNIVNKIWAENGGWNPDNHG